MEFSRYPTRLALLASAFGTALALMPGFLAAESKPPTFEHVQYRQASDQVIATFHYVYPEFAEQNFPPLLRIYGDHTVLVNHPRFMKNTGCYAMRLDQHEADSLMRDITTAVMGFEPNRVNEEIRLAEYAKWDKAARLNDITIHATADPTISSFTIDIESYLPVGVGNEVLVDGPRSAVWPALAFDAERFPGILPLQALKAAEERLTSLTTDRRLRLIVSGSPAGCER
jgi:hypothetical protein